MEFNSQLDLKKMAEYRINKTRMAANSMLPTLRNNRIPLEYKKMIINNVISPMVSYGAEAFGLNETRMQKAKTTVDRCILCIVNDRNFPRNRVYEELDIKPIQIKAAISRIRSYDKWRKNDKILCKLIGTADNLKQGETSGVKQRKNG